MNAFIETLLIYGSCLKNLELITKVEKVSAFDDYLTGLCIMLAILKRHAEEFFDRMKNLMFRKFKKHKIHLKIS